MVRSYTSRKLYLVVWYYIFKDESERRLSVPVARTMKEEVSFGIGNIGNELYDKKIILGRYICLCGIYLRRKGRCGDAYLAQRRRRERHTIRRGASSFNTTLATRKHRTNGEISPVSAIPCYRKPKHLFNTGIPISEYLF